jgi:hypothetical protein
MVTLHDLILHDVFAYNQEEKAMERFLKRHEGRLRGIISGFDRILFRGSLRSICYSAGIQAWLASQGILMKDFRSYAMELSERIKEHAQRFAQTQGRPYQHIFSPKDSKEDIARDFIQKEQIHEGLVCVLSCVEPCRSFKFVRLSNKKNHCGLKPADRQCLHLYFYFLDREFGLMHIRLQTWLPFTIQVCLNGWEWLAHRLDREGISYQKSDNCFLQIEDLDKAQQLMNCLIDRNWLSFLQRMARLANPWMQSRNPLDLQPYYWSIRECEYATDILFKDKARLQAVYPYLLDHAIHHFHSQDILRFLQRKVNCLFQGEVKSSFKVRVEGTRIKHWVEENSIKMYDKQGSVLRVETTMNNPRRWRVWRRTTRKGKRCMAWIPMRKSIADIKRRSQVCLAANIRYLDALSVVGESVPIHKVLDPLAQRLTRVGRSYRPLHPVDPADAELLSVISRGEFLLHGFRNQDVRKLLHPGSETSPSARRKTCGQVSRKLRLLQAHGLTYKVAKTNLWRLSRRGQIVTAMVNRLRMSNLLDLERAV